MGRVCVIRIAGGWFQFGNAGYYDDLSGQNDGRKASAYDAHLGKPSFGLSAIAYLLLLSFVAVRHSKRSNNKNERDT